MAKRRTFWGFLRENAKDLTFWATTFTNGVITALDRVPSLHLWASADVITARYVDAGPGIMESPNTCWETYRFRGLCSIMGGATLVGTCITLWDIYKRRRDGEPISPDVWLELTSDVFRMVSSACAIGFVLAPALWPCAVASSVSLALSMAFKVAATYFKPDGPLPAQSTPQVQSPQVKPPQVKPPQVKPPQVKPPRVKPHAIPAHEDFMDGIRARHAINVQQDLEQVTAAHGLAALQNQQPPAQTK